MQSAAGKLSCNKTALKRCTKTEILIIIVIIIYVYFVRCFKDGPFVWPKEIQGHILGSFFIGYLLSQIPGGLMAERLGAKWVLMCFLGLSTLATLLTPTAARLGYQALIAVRIAAGIGSVRSLNIGDVYGVRQKWQHSIFVLNH